MCVNRYILGFRILSALVIVIMTVPLIATAQPNNDQKARAYYFEAERALEERAFNEALSALDNVEQLLGSSNASTTAMKVKIYYAQEKYEVAK